jgi:short-subunit dehydrogenase
MSHYDAADESAGLRKVALITGASAGIGAELARVFARHGHDLALVARNGARLEALAREIAAVGGLPPLILSLDLARTGAADELAARMAEAGVAPDILVNNAGFGLAGQAMIRDRIEQLGIIDLNIRALTDITLHFLPALVAGRGRILNVASVAGFLPGPGMAVYYASKAYVVSFSLALAQELRSQGVSVTTLCPGYTPTEFQARAGLKSEMSALAPVLPAARVAEAGYAGLRAGRRLVVPGLLNKMSVSLLPFVPTSLLLPLLARLQSRRHDD